MTVTYIFIIICICVLFICYILDGYIRKKIYITDVNLAKIRAKKEVAQPHTTVGSKAWMEMMQVNNFRYGIAGDFNYDIKPTDVYELSGTQTFIATGVVLDKKFITKEEIVDDMATFAKTGKKFVADPKELRDRHIVVMYIQNKDMKEFIWDNKGLYDNIEKGESVSISYNNKGPLSVGYKLKGERNDSNPKGKMDMGDNQKVS